MLPSSLPPFLRDAVRRPSLALAVLSPPFGVGVISAVRRAARAGRAWGLSAAFVAAFALSAWATLASGGQTIAVSGAVAPDTGAPGTAPGRELEHETDRARARFVAGDGRAAALDLRAASRRLADAARAADAGAAASALTTSAQELAAVAVAIDGGTVPCVCILDGAIARARLADARLHHARVMPLVRNLHNAEAGIELLWVVDHLGRAMREGTSGAGVAAPLLDDARAAALRLTRPSLGVSVSTGVLLEQLGAALDRAMPRAASAVRWPPAASTCV